MPDGTAHLLRRPLGGLVDVAHDVDRLLPEIVLIVADERVAEIFHAVFIACEDAGKHERVGCFATVSKLGPKTLVERASVQAAGPLLSRPPTTRGSRHPRKRVVAAHNAVIKHAGDMQHE